MGQSVSGLATYATPTVKNAVKSLMILKQANQDGAKNVSNFNAHYEISDWKGGENLDLHPKLYGQWNGRCIRDGSIFSSRL